VITEPDWSSFTLGPNDLAQVTVYGQPELTSEPTGVRIAPDGTLSLSLTDPIAIAGLTPSAAAKTIEGALAAYIQRPSVSVSVVEYTSRRFYLFGEVTNADLAIVFAKAGRKVLLVDCDLRKPQIYNLFSVERSPGMGDVLEGGAAWRDCVQETDNGHLDILPAGKKSSSPGELLAGERALEVIEKLKASYDLIVFDLPPAVVVADVANFASNLDALLLVYRSGKVPGRLLTGAVNKLRQAEVNVPGVIINAVYVSRALGGYGYGYGTEESKRGST
jgi:capsular exopolysaccharide synthesis family protein